MSSSIVNAQGNRLSGGVGTRLLGKMDVKVARHVLGKDTKTDGDKIEDAARSFVDDLNTELSKIGEQLVDNPWAAPPVAEGAEAQSQSQPSESTFVQYDHRGKRSGVVREKLLDLGFYIGCRVVRKADPTDVIQVTGFSDDDGLSGLAVAEDGSVTRTERSIVAGDLADWEVAKKAPDVVDLSKTSPANDDAYFSSIVKSHVVLAIAGKAMDIGTPAVVAQTAPTNSVFAGADFEAGELILVFESRKLVIAKSGVECNKKGVVVKLPPSFDNRVSYIVGSNGDGFFSPAWHVRDGDGREPHNMVLRHETVLSNIGKSSVEIGVPVLVNASAIKEGDELIADKKANSEDAVAGSNVVVEGTASASTAGASSIASDAAAHAQKRQGAGKKGGQPKKQRK